MMRKLSLPMALGGAALLLLAACDDPATTAVSTATELSRGVVNQPGTATASPEAFTICKYGTSATFDVSTSSTFGTSSQTVTLAEDECRIVAYPDGDAQSGAVATEVTVTEQVPTGYTLDHVDVTINQDGSISGPTSVAGPTVTDSVGGGNSTVGLRGVLAEFYNVAIPTGGEGCTPGFWKNHTGAWMGAASGDLFTSVGFTDAWTPANPEKNVDPSTLTLLQALELRGGGVNALARHAVAAWLNASHTGVDYDLTTTEVVTLFNDAVSSGDVESAKDQLVGFNEQGCPLGAADF